MAPKRDQRKLKVLFVVQRYGLEINGGAELHCRWIAEHLKDFFDIEVLTTCALDYITWRNHYREGKTLINGVNVSRFRTSRERNLGIFGPLQERIFYQTHTLTDEERWVTENGPLSNGLMAAIRERGEQADAILFWSYRYFPSFYGLDLYPEKSILVPTAERDRLLDIGLFQRQLKKPCGFVYLTPEEKGIVERASGNGEKPFIISACGIEPNSAKKTDVEAFKKKHNIDKPYLIYVGRVDRNKGCRQMFEFFRLFKQRNQNDYILLLIGSPKMDLPSDSFVRSLGFASEEIKKMALAGADLLVMPSFYESLSIILLEAWASGLPSVVNGQCEVLNGQTLRSGAGLFYRNYMEFERCLNKILSEDDLRKRMSVAGREFVREFYSWRKVQAQYSEFIRKIAIKES